MHISHTKLDQFHILLDQSRIIGLACSLCSRCSESCLRSHCSLRQRPRHSACSVRCRALPRSHDPSGNPIPARWRLRQSLSAVPCWMREGGLWVGSWWHTTGKTKAARRQPSSDQPSAPQYLRRKRPATLRNGLRHRRAHGAGGTFQDQACGCAWSRFTGVHRFCLTTPFDFDSFLCGVQCCKRVASGFLPAYPHG